MMNVGAMAAGRSMRSVNRSSLAGLAEPRDALGDPALHRGFLGIHGLAAPFSLFKGL